MRAAFSKTLVDLAKADPSVVLLTGDHGYALFDEFRRSCPSQYINAGIAEQNMVGMSAGLARTGFRPIIYGLSAFIPIRVLEQIKLDVAHDNLPVIFIGDGAGLVYSHLGTSHQSTEDIACARVIPNLKVFSPADAAEMIFCLRAAYESNSSVYIRIGKSDLGKVHQDEPNLRTGQLMQLREGANNDLAFVATGSLVRCALDIAAESCYEASVWSVPFIKPIDEHQIIDICKKSKVVITFEEHSIFGGLGSVVTEIASEHLPVRVLRIGVKDRFSEYCGSYNYLISEHGLDRMGIVKQLDAFLLNQTRSL
jgi:transketolase